MIYNLEFHYRIEKEAGWGEDNEGNPSAVYCEIKLGECDTEERDFEAEKRAHLDTKTIGNILNIDPKFITPVSKEEYDANMVSEGGRVMAEKCPKCDKPLPTVRGGETVYKCDCGWFDCGKIECCICPEWAVCNL